MDDGWMKGQVDGQNDGWMLCMDRLFGSQHCLVGIEKMALLWTSDGGWMHPVDDQSTDTDGSSGSVSDPDESDEDNFQLN